METKYLPTGSVTPPGRASPCRKGHYGQMHAATISETKNNLSALLDRVRAGESVVILDRDRPVARIVPVREADDAHLADLERRGLLRRGAVGVQGDVYTQPGPVPSGGGDILAALLADREDGR